MAINVFVKNTAGLSNKYVRFIKWKLRKVKEKFEWVKEARVFLKKEGIKAPTYKATIILKVSDKILVINQKSKHLPKLWKEMYEETQRYLRKYRDRKLKADKRILKPII